MSPCEEILVCGTLAKELAEGLETVFWRWPIAKCRALWHLHLYAAGVTCVPAMNEDVVLKALRP